MTTKHLIIDFETIGTNSLCVPAINCAALVFDWEDFYSKPKGYDDFLSEVAFFKFDLKNQLDKYGCGYKTEDLDFWKSLPKEVKRQILPSKEDLKVKEFTDKFLAFLATNSIRTSSFWWSRCNTFDPLILRRLFEYSGRDLDDYLGHFKVRDTRTFIDTSFDFKTPNDFIPVSDHKEWNKKFKKHVSIHDVVADVMRLQAISRALTDMNEVDIEGKIIG